MSANRAPRRASLPDSRSGIQLQEKRKAARLKRARQVRPIPARSSTPPAKCPRSIFGARLAEPWSGACRTGETFEESGNASKVFGGFKAVGARGRAHLDSRSGTLQEAGGACILRSAFPIMCSWVCRRLFRSSKRRDAARKAVRLEFRLRLPLKSALSLGRLPCLLASPGEPAPAGRRAIGG